MVDNLTNSLNAHEVTSINDDPFLFKTMNKINNMWPDSVEYPL